MQITKIAETPETAETAKVEEHRPPASRRSRRRRPLALAGALAAAAALTVSFLVVDSDTPSSAATVEAALARSSSLLAQSGRAEVTSRIEFNSGDVGTGVDSWEFSGDDSSVTMDSHLLNGIPQACQGPDGEPLPDLSTCHYEDPILRVVDGQQYIYNGDPDGTYGWTHYVDGDAEYLTEFSLDPATLLDELQPAGGFEEVGREPVDGVETTRLRATNPRQTPLADFENVVLAGDTVTSLEVWVDPDGLVRRLDLTTGSSDSRFRTASWSIRFFDHGAPITIQAPTDYEDVSVAG